MGLVKEMEERETFCLFCSLGCKLAVKVDKGMPVSPEFCADYPVNEGRLCPKGLYAMELLDHPMRIVAPQIKDNGKFKEASWEESLHSLVSKISEMKDKYGSQSIGIIIDPNHTNEEILAAQELAKIIGTDSLACSFPPNDWDLLCSSITFPGNIEDVENVNCSLIVGDPFVTHSVLAKRVIAAKYKARGNSIIVIDPKRTNTAWFANTHLQNKPGSEALLLVGLLKSILSSSPEKGITEKLQTIPDETISKATGLSTGQIAAAAKAFNDAEKGLVVLSPGLRGIKDINSVVWLCKLLVDNAKGDKQLMPLFTFGNAVGAFKMSSGNGWKGLPPLIEELSSGKIKLLIDFGEDLVSSYPSSEVRKGLEQLEFLAVSSLFASEMKNIAHLILPCASWLEKSGSVNFFDGRREYMEPILMPAWAAKSDLEIVCELSQELGAPLDRERIRREAEALSSEGFSKREEKLDIDKLVRRINALIEETVIEDKEYPYLLISDTATGHFADGSITRNMSWAREMFPASFIELSTEDAQEIKVKNGDEVLVSSRSGETALTAQVTDRLCKGVVSVPSYSADIRGVFEWKTTPEGKFQTAPEKVRISRKER